MGFTTIKSTQLSASGAVKSGTARVKSIYVAHGATTGTVILKDGGGTGTTTCTINTAAGYDVPAFDWQAEFAAVDLARSERACRFDRRSLHE